jgi:hypothetical protein
MQHESEFIDVDEAILVYIMLVEDVVKDLSQLLFIHCLRSILLLLFLLKNSLPMLYHGSLVFVFWLR